MDSRQMKDIREGMELWVYIPFIFALFIVFIVKIGASLSSTRPPPTSLMNWETNRDIIEWARDFGIRFPEVFVAQVYHEATDPKDRTQWSNIGKGNKNLTGMKSNTRSYNINGVKVSRAECEKLRQQQKCVDCVHACYESYEECFKDYREWQTIFIGIYERYHGRKIQTTDDYLRFLDNYVLAGRQGYRYGTDPKYTKRVRWWMKRLSEADSRLEG